MKEYNWREERKKYQANGSRSNDNDAQQQPQTPPPVQPAVAVAVAAAPRKPSMAVIALLSLLAIAVIGIFVLLFTRSSDPKPEKIEKIAAGKINVSLPDQPAASNVSSPIVVTTGSQDTALKLQQQAEKHKYAVGVVAATLELKTGNKFVNAIGTAWAFDRNKFATNSHVVLGIKTSMQDLRIRAAQWVIAREFKIEEQSVNAFLQKMDKDKAQQLVTQALQFVANNTRAEDAIIVINGGAGDSYSVSHVQTHRNYGIVDTKVSPDVAVLTIYGDHKNYFRIASQEKLYALKSGEAIAFLGFPMELLQDNNLNLESPVATMQTGIVTAVTDFYSRDAGVRNNQWVKHNLPATGGASGSPIFNANGEVVALLCGGNIVPQVKTEKGTLTRLPSAALVNFAVRADLLRGVGKRIPLDEFLH